jgi:uncharacterized protein YggT (Ycf19 family)
MYRKTAYILTVLLRIILWIIEGFLALRLILRLLDVNPSTPIAAFVYASTDVLLQPFRGLFPVEEIARGYFLEFSTLLAMAVYGLVLFLFLELIRWAANIQYASHGTATASPPTSPRMSYYKQPKQEPNNPPPKKDKQP